MTIKQTFKEERSHVPVHIWTDDIEPSARLQLANLSTLPFLHSHVAAMADCHWGLGSTVGSVIATTKAIIPAAVGVDIGCGMIARKLHLRADELPDSLHNMRLSIEARVPHGRTDNGGVNDKGSWQGEMSGHIYGAFDALLTSSVGMRDLITHIPRLDRAMRRAPRQLGTLGGGNHFIELCLDLENNVWIMLHSGSRGIGNAIGQHFIEEARQEMRRWFVNLPDEDLAYLPEGSRKFEDYVLAVKWAQEYAAINREYMLQATLQGIADTLGFKPLCTQEAINCHHNYISIEEHFGEQVYVTRKGAVRAGVGDLGIIPGSMGTKSFIVRGKGNPDSFHSCSHGAGRRMSRGEAKRTFSLEDFASQTAGVECRHDADVIDEIPGAYKDIDTVMANQHDLVDVVAELKQVLCIKG